MSQHTPWTYARLREAALQHNVDKYRWSTLAHHPFSRLRKAAVLVPLFLQDGEIRVWLTKRSMAVGTHKGEVAFPGGMKDEQDQDEAATCLREAHEEIGLQPQQVEVVAQLLPRVNGRQIFICPMVGFVSELFHPEPNEEVDLVFHLPLSRFLKDERYEGRPFVIQGKDIVVPCFYDDVGSNWVATWGITAQVCVELAVALFKEETEFEYSGKCKLGPDDAFRVQREYLADFEERLQNKSKL